MALGVLALREGARILEFNRIRVNLSRIVPVESILLHIYVKGDTINGLLIFKMFVVISSHPHELLLFNSLIIFSISPVVVFFSLIFVKDC